MANITSTDGIRLTKKGLELLAKTQTGQQMFFSSVILGQGVLLDDESVADLSSVKDVVTTSSSDTGSTAPKLDITRLTAENDGTVTLCIKVISGDTAFYMREIGIMATDPDCGEILYGYINFGDTASYMPSYNNGGDTYVVRNITLTFVVSDASQVSANITLPAEVSFEEFEEYKAEMNAKLNNNAIYVQCTGEDDTTALQAAIDKASEGSIVYPVGECVLTNTGKGEGEDIIAIKSGVTLDGRYCKKVTFKYTVLERVQKWDDDEGYVYSIPTPQNIFNLATNSAMKNVNFTEDTSNMTDAYSCVFPVIVKSVGGEITHCMFVGVVSTGVCYENGFSSAYESFIGDTDTIFEYNTIKNFKVFETTIDTQAYAMGFNIGINNCHLENITYGGSSGHEVYSSMTSCFINNCAFDICGKFTNNEVHNSEIHICSTDAGKAFADNYLYECNIPYVVDGVYIIGNYFISPTNIDIGTVNGVVINNVTTASSFGDLDMTNVAEGNITGI